MTKPQLQILGARVGNALSALLLPDVHFFVLVAAQAEPGEYADGAPHLHTNTSGSIPGPDLAIILRELLHAVEANAEAIRPDGRTHDLTPTPGGAS